MPGNVKRWIKNPLRANELFGCPVETEDRKLTGVDSRTHSKPTTVLAPASVIDSVDHHPSAAEALKKMYEKKNIIKYIHKENKQE